MDDGSLTRNMAMSGFRMKGLIFDHIVPMALGYGQMTMNGRGYQTMIGVGLRSTMAVGFMILFMVGYGCRVMNGHLHGSHGDRAAIITDGRPLVRESVSILIFL